MPYGGTTPSQDKKIERCVKSKMSDPKFKPYRGNTKKQSAIALCKAAVLKVSKK